MIFTLNNSILLTQIILVSAIYQYSSHFGVISGTFLVDLATRVDTNSPGLTGMYWLWTNTYYLYTVFILTLLLAYLNLTTLNYSSAMLFILLYINAMIYEMYYNLSMSTYLQPIEDNMSYYNLLLNNCINKLHPMLIYMSWTMLASFFLLSSPLYHTSYSTSILINNTTALMFSTLVMGGWWAYQEGSWGGWWNWDPSEMFGLLILGGLLIFSHSDATHNSNLIIYANSISLSLIAYYCFLQLNFSLISHNFGISQGDLVDFSVFYLFIFIILSVYASSKNSRNDLLYLLSSNNSAPLAIMIAAVYSLLISTIYFSTLELWASLSWNVLSLDIQHYLNVVPALNIALLVALYITYSVSESRWVLLVILSAYFSTPLASLLILLYAYVYSLLNLKNLHLTMLLTLLALALYSSYSYTIVSTFSTISTLDTMSSNLPLLHVSTHSSLGFDEVIVSQTSSLNSNSIELKLFTLNNNAHDTLQNYSISNEDVLVNSTVAELYNSFILTIIYIFYFIYNANSTRILIISS